MANGTIAFDTLQTSGQITGTAKSVDTDYVVNGSAKQWVNITGTSTVTVNDSLNTTSVTDTSLGRHTPNLTNAMSNANYVYNFTVQRAATNDVLFVTHRYDSNPTTSAYTPRTFHTDNDEAPSGEDPDILCCSIHGDLA